MKALKRLLPMLALALLASCGGDDNGTEQNGGTETPPGQTGEQETSAFARGADISWVTEQEADGVKFYDASGRESDCFELMKSIGMTAIRLRVWVNPSTPASTGHNAGDGGYGSSWCDKEETVKKALRAKAAGLDVMIDFHYSDLFADPSRQATPTAWRGKTLSELKTLVGNHTTEVLNALKDRGVEPRWIQIGNETRNGMLHPTGRLWDGCKCCDGTTGGWSNYAALTNAGYEAAKAVCPDAIVMVHIDNAYDTDTNRWWLEEAKKSGVKFDMIGLSHYPMANDNMTWEQANALAVKNIKTWAQAYSVPVMVCEVGVKPAQSDAARCLSAFMSSVRALDCCAGVFYWEPQVYGNWRPAVYKNVFGWGAYDMGGFTANGRPAPLLDCFKQ